MEIETDTVEKIRARYAHRGSVYADGRCIYVAVYGKPKKNDEL